MNNTTLAARDLRVLWHPCTQMEDHEQRPPIAIRRGRGPWLEDFDGNRYLDGISSWWVNLFGHAHPGINEAIRAQLDALEHVLLAGFTHEPVIRLSEELLKLVPAGLSRCFYADSGSAAVEIALKMSLHYWRNQGRPRKTRFVSLANGYHGETLGALALSDLGLYRAPYEPILNSWFQVTAPDCQQRREGETCAQQFARALAEMEQLLAAHAEELCAVVVEPLVQCAGGMRMYPPAYLSQLRAACDRHGVHLIADEVAVGFGRTGTLFACEQAAITPDFLCLGKGLTGGYLPLSACITREHIYQAFYGGGPERAFLHSHSFTGSALGCAAALATLSIFAEEDVLATNRRRAALLQDLLSRLQHHPHVADLRQTGMIAALDLVLDRDRREAYPSAERRGRIACQHALSRGALLRPLGDVLYLMPPFVTNEEELELLVDALAQGIDYATG